MDGQLPQGEEPHLKFQGRDHLKGAGEANVYLTDEEQAAELAAIQTAKHESPHERPFYKEALCRLYSHYAAYVYGGTRGATQGIRETYAQSAAGVQ